jgi:hypothetical protein
MKMEICKYPEPYDLAFAEIRLIKFNISSDGIFLSFPAFSASFSSRSHSFFVLLREMEGILKHLTEIEKEVIKNENERTKFL